MGLMSMLDFRDEVSGMLQRGDPKTVGEKRLDRWIMNTMFEFGYAIKFRELQGEATIDLNQGDAGFFLPDNFRMIHENGIYVMSTIANVNQFKGKVLPETREQYLLHFNNDPTVVGVPLWYHIFVLPTLKVRPISDADYKIILHYWKKIELESTDSVAPFKEEWDDIICTGAAAKGLRFFGESDRAINMKADFVGMIKSRVMEEDLEEFPVGSLDPYPKSEQELRFGIR